MDYDFTGDMNDAEGEESGECDDFPEDDCDNLLDHDDECLTTSECIQKAFEILAELRDDVYLDPIITESIETVHALLSRVIESNGEVVLS